MNLSSYIKKFDFSKNFLLPQSLNYENLTARPLTRQHLREDLEAVNSNRELILRTRGGSWPEAIIDEDYDLLDLVWHEREFKEKESFAYSIYDKNNKYIGCFYLYPMGYRTDLNEELNNYDVDVSWWVTNEAYENGRYEELFKALKTWLNSDFPFKKPYFSNKEIPNESN